MFFQLSRWGHGCRHSPGDQRTLATAYAEGLALGVRSRERWMWGGGEPAPDLRAGWKQEAIAGPVRVVSAEEPPVPGPLGVAV